MESTLAVAMFAALAQESRLGVFRRLARSVGEVTAGELARELNVPANTMSFHLKELAAAGLVLSRRDGRRIWFRLDQANVGRLMDFLLRECCDGRPELCGPTGTVCGASGEETTPVQLATRFPS
jgi:ArsR family transcriptional regulator